MECHLGAEVTTRESETNSALGCMPQNLRTGLPEVCGGCAEQQRRRWDRYLEWRAASFENHRSFPYSQQQVAYGPDRSCKGDGTFSHTALSTEVQNRVPLTRPSSIY